LTGFTPNDMNDITTKLSRAQISRAAIERLYIAMRHLFIRGSYKPLGISGEAMIKALLELKPEIYGSVADPEKVELNGLNYVFQRLPLGIEECAFIKLISREGFEDSPNEPIIPAKRRRNCYRIDADQMYIEMTRGRSDIYDVLTHLTFMYIEAEKIRKNALDHKGRYKREWIKLEEIIQKQLTEQEYDQRVGFTYLATLLGRTYAETATAFQQFEKAEKVNNLFSIVYWLGKRSIDEYLNDEDREISFSSTLREKIGLHILGTNWAQDIKGRLDKEGLLDRPIHIVSANLHSVMNSFFALPALGDKLKSDVFFDIAEHLSESTSGEHRDMVKAFALKNGMIQIEDKSGVNIGCQLFDCAKLDPAAMPEPIRQAFAERQKKQDVIIVIDYAFGEQAFELMDELLKPYEIRDEKLKLDVQSINIMGKAGILRGKKGDIMIPDAHIFEGSTDNYPFENHFDESLLSEAGLQYIKGPMITVLGTSLQNKDVLRYFLRSSWRCIGLEMEGAHYQKAIQSASRIRKSISKDVMLRYAYYASDNPLETGSTLASGGLGIGGVLPTYLITFSMLGSIAGQERI